jgi:hypothetical protein
MKRKGVRSFGKGVRWGRGGSTRESEVRWRGTGRLPLTSLQTPSILWDVIGQQRVWEEEDDIYLRKGREVEIWRRRLMKRSWETKKSGSANDD